MSGQRCRLGCHALHQIAVADDRVDLIIHHLIIGTVITCGKVPFRNCHPDAVGETLTQRSGGCFDPRRMAVLGMPRRLAPPLTEVFEIVECQVVAGQVEQAVEEHATMAGGEDKTIPVIPGRVRRVVFQVAHPEDVRHGRCPHRQAGVARLCLLNGVDGQGANRIDAELIEFRGCLGHGW